MYTNSSVQIHNFRAIYNGLTKMTKQTGDLEMETAFSSTVCCQLSLAKCTICSKRHTPQSGEVQTRPRKYTNPQDLKRIWGTAVSFPSIKTEESCQVQQNSFSSAFAQHGWKGVLSTVILPKYLVFFSSLCLLHFL